MARIIGIGSNITDDAEVAAELSAGRLGKGFKDIANEDTASLGLKKSITEVSRSAADFFNPDRAHEFPGADAIQFITAKLYEQREFLGKSVRSASYVEKIINASSSVWTTASKVQMPYSADMGVAPHQFTNIGSATTQLLKATDGTKVTDNGSGGNYIANVQIPEGKQATHVQIYGSKSAGTFKAHVNNYASLTTLNVTPKTGAVNINVNMALVSAVTGSNTQYFTIEAILAASAQIYGAKITLADI